MNCMKCGRETGTDNAFCDACLEEMGRHPVNPATVILLPGQGRPQPKKTAPKKALPSLEEQVGFLRRKVRRLRILILLLAVLVAVLGVVVRKTLSELDFQRLLGQNYSTVQQTEPTETGPEA